MEQIKTLLLAPATDTPLKAEIATQYTSDLAAYEAKVRETVAAYAK
jgi:ubiquitin-protein ligase